MSWMPWIVLSVAVGVVGVAVLAAMAVRVLVAVRDLGREVQRSQERLEPKLAAFEEAAQHRNGAHAGGGRPAGAERAGGAAG